ALCMSLVWKRVRFQTGAGAGAAAAGRVGNVSRNARAARAAAIARVAGAGREGRRELGLMPDAPTCYHGRVRRGGPRPRAPVFITGPGPGSNCETAARPGGIATSMKILRTHGPIYLLLLAVVFTAFGRVMTVPLWN